MLAERGQDVRDVLHEEPVRADDEDAGAREPVALGVEEPRRAVEADRGLPRAGAALEHERPVGRVCDQPVLVGLDRGDDVSHPRVPRAVELLEQEVTDRGTVERCAVERLVRDVEQPAAVGAEAAAEGDALRIDRRRRIERPRGGRLPVDDELAARVVLDPAPTDIEGPLDVLEVEPAEEEPALGVLVGDEALRAPRLERERRDLLVGRRRGARDEVAHPVERRVGTIDVVLLLWEVRVAHASERTPPEFAGQRAGDDRCVNQTTTRGATTWSP